MHPYNVILKPVVSEKSAVLRENEGKYAFLVDTKATKTDVKKAIEMMYNVKVSDVNTIVQRGKMGRRGQHMFKRPNFKKAIIALAGGAKLPLFEEQ